MDIEKKRMKKAEKDCKKVLTSSEESDIITGLSTRRQHRGF